MKKFRDLMEAKDTVVFAYGRFNPPTTGHEKVIEKVVSIAGTNDYRIYPSHSQNPKKDPLPQALKTAYMRKMFKKYAKKIVVSKSRNAIEIAVELYDQGYKNLVMVAGSDRVKVFDTMLNNYNGVEGKPHGYYKFDSIKIVSAGERDPDSEGVEGMSASKMRAAASEGDMDSFLQGIPSGFSDGKKLYRDVRKYMGIREERDMGDMNNYDELRDAYLTGKIWNAGDIVEANGLVGEIVRKGTNYLSFMSEDGKVHKAWLHEIELDERNYRKEYDNYHAQPEQREKNAARLRARRLMVKNGKVKPFDDMDVHHKDNNPLNNEEENLKVTTKKWNRTEPRLREEKVPSDDLNWIKTGGMVGKKRRFPTFIVKKERNKYNAYDEQNKMSLKAGANNLEGLVKMLKPYIEKRTGSWKFEGIDLDETWWDNLTAKISQMTHPKGYEDMVKDYIKLMKQKEYKKHPSLAGSLVAREYHVPLKGFISYINKLVAKGKLPKELKAEYVPEMSFKDLVQQIQERELTDTEQKRREEIAKGMSDKDFKKKYGDRWKEVKMAVATNMAKKESLKT